MTYCTECNAFQPRLKRGLECNDCFGKLNNNSVKRKDGNNQNPNNNYQGLEMNSLDQNLISGIRPHVTNVFPISYENQPIINTPHNIVTDLQQYSSASNLNNRSILSYNVNNQPTGAMSSAITKDNLGEFLNKPMSEVTVADLIKINNISIDPMKQQLVSIQNEFRDTIENLDNRVELIEKDKDKLEEENYVLRGVVTNMQKCLNILDNNERSKNIIVSGVPEGNVQIDNTTLKTEREKIKWILHLTENRYFDDKVDDLSLSRLGAEKRGYNRTIKIILESSDERNEFLKNTMKLKNAPDPWNKVFIKKDQHPVYLHEDNRSQKNVATLKRTQGYENKDIKIVGGKVMVDNVAVDRNLFFH